MSTLKDWPLTQHLEEWLPRHCRSKYRRPRDPQNSTLWGTLRVTFWLYIIVSHCLFLREFSCEYFASYLSREIRGGGGTTSFTGSHMVEEGPHCNISNFWPHIYGYKSHSMWCCFHVIFCLLGIILDCTWEWWFVWYIVYKPNAYAIYILFHGLCADL